MPMTNPHDLSADEQLLYQECVHAIDIFPLDPLVAAELRHSPDVRGEALLFIEDYEIGPAIDTFLRGVQAKFIDEAGPGRVSWAAFTDALNARDDDNSIDLDVFEEIYNCLSERTRLLLCEELQQELWKDLEQRLSQAPVKAIAFDGCHKIYVISLEDPLSDSIWRQWSRAAQDADTNLRYLEVENMEVREVAETLRSWFDISCPLRFIQEMSDGEGEAHYDDLIEQAHPLFC